LDDVREELDIDPTEEQGRVIQMAKERCRERLRAGEDFAFNATNLTAQLRKLWIDLFARYEARVEIVYLEPPFDAVIKQNRERDRRVPERVIYRLRDRAEPPLPGEGHVVRWMGGED
jgi:predicted kinase